MNTETTNTTKLAALATEAAQPNQVQPTADAPRNEPLAMRAQTRKLELEKALAALPADDARGRKDIELVLGSITTLLSGDVEHLSASTAAELSRLLENNKHLAETNVAPATKS